MENEIENTSTKEPKGLPGLALVREAIGISVPALARLVEVHPNFVNRVQACAQSCSFRTLVRLAHALCCLSDDLLLIPTPQRIAEIKANYFEREATRARAEFNLKKKGVA